MNGVKNISRKSAQNGRSVKEFKSLLESAPLFLHPHGRHEESILQLQSEGELGFDICMYQNKMSQVIFTSITMTANTKTP